MGNSCLKVLGFECAGNREKHISEVSKDRVCTDVPCCLLFIFVWAAIIGILVFSIENGGDPNKLIRGVDFNGAICGIDSAVANQPLGAWPDPTEFDFQVCLDDCAKTEEFDHGYTSFPFLNFCIPDAVSAIPVPPELSSGTETFNRYIGDLNVAKYMILGAAGIALLFSFVYAWLSKKVISFLVWGSILITFVFGVVLSYTLLSEAQKIDSQNVTDQSNEKKLLNIFGGISVVLTFLFFVIIVALRKRISIAIEVVREAAKAVFDMPMMIFYPIWPFCWTVGLFAFWISVALYLWTAGELVDTAVPTPELADEFGLDTYKSFAHDENFKNAAIFHVFFLFWAFAFTVYSTYIIIAGAIADWYFTMPENDVRRVDGSPIWRSFKRNTFYHLGTVAFGSLLIAIVQMIRAVIRYIEEKTRSQSNHAMKAVICMCKCCFWCLEVCLDKLSKNGLIFTAIYGDAFCAASWNAFALLVRNLARVAAINIVGEYVIVIGKLMVSVVTTGICGLVFIETDFFKDNLSSPIMPLIVIFILSYLIGSIFMVIFETAIDTIFLCFLVDEECNADGKMFASESLLEVIGKYEKDSQEIAEANKDAVGLSEPLLNQDPGTKA